ncbi:MAG TPA: response regulator [Anaerolineales bacterium]|nr:response regulator [Anaerolineales bacterium]
MSRFLVVDDEPDLRSYIADELSDDGHQVDTAADGVEAVMRVIDGGVDAVVMDIRMPRLDGLNALRILRRLSPSLPVVMFTGQAGQGDMLETTRLGAVTCLLKPVNIDRLKEILVQSVNRKKIAA